MLEKPDQTLLKDYEHDSALIGPRASKKVSGPRSRGKEGGRGGRRGLRKDQRPVPVHGIKRMQISEKRINLHMHRWCV